MSLNFFEWVLDAGSIDLHTSLVAHSAFGPNGDYVILLHDLVRTNNSMRKLADSLAKKNFIVFNCDYSRSKSQIEEIYKVLLPKLMKKYCNVKNKKIHIIAHSYGAYLALNILNGNEFLNIDKVIFVDPLIENCGKKATFYNFLWSKIFIKKMNKKRTKKLFDKYNIRSIYFSDTQVTSDMPNKHIFKHELSLAYYFNPMWSDNLIGLISSLLIKKL